MSDVGTGRDDPGTDGGVTGNELARPATVTGNNSAQVEARGVTAGNNSAQVAAGGAADDVHAREVDIHAISRRLQDEGRWTEAAPVRDELMRASKASGKTKAERQADAYLELARRFPPVQSQPEQPADGSIPGLGDLPEEWPEIPPNASLSAEIAWVQSNRLLVIQGESVDLSRAREPAPSLAAIGWLETSIRAYTKYCDIAAKATAQQQDEREHVKRERLRIEEMEALLAEMHED